MRRRSAGDIAFESINVAFMVIIMAICILPFLYIFSRAVSSGNAIMSGKVMFFPVGFQLESFKGIFAQQGFFVSYLNTALYTFTGTAFTMIVTVLCAYPLSKKKVVFRAVFMALFVATMFFNGGLIPNFVLISRLGFIDEIWSLVLPIAFNQFYIILVMGSIQGIPQDLEESAVLDGLNPFGTLLHIILPLIKPVLATVALFTALNLWNDWFTPMLYLNSNEKFPIMLLLKNIIVGTDITMASMNVMTGPGGIVSTSSLKAAAVIMVILPIVMIYPFLQKYFVKGMMLGSIKG